jgi:hypothetical protein
MLTQAWRSTHSQFCAAVLQDGWGLTPCQSCGANVLTDTSDSDGLGTSPDSCYIPAGWGSVVNARKQLIAVQCGNGSFGVPDRTYGLDPHPCQVRRG